MGYGSPASGGVEGWAAGPLGILCSMSSGGTGLPLGDCSRGQGWTGRLGGELTGEVGRSIRHSILLPSPPIPLLTNPQGKGLLSTVNF